MAELGMESKVRVEGGEVWIKATLGRLKAFLTKYDARGPLNDGSADKFLALLRHAMTKVVDRS